MRCLDILVRLKKEKNMAKITKIKNRTQKTNLSRYAGQWVAFLNSKVVSNKNSLSDLVKELEKKGIRKKSSVFLVPRQDEGPYVLFSL